MSDPKNIGDSGHELDRVMLALQNNYLQLEAYIAICSQFHFRLPLPPMRGWAISPDFGRIYIRQILSMQPKTIVELGSGVSTLLAAYCCEKLSTGHVTAIDHDAAFAERTAQLIEEHKLQKYASVRHSPLEEITLNGEKWSWYGGNVVRDLPSIDLLIVDGPPQDLAPRQPIRYPAVPILFKQLSNNAVILVDDARRSGELWCIDRWTKEFPLDAESVDETEKGAAKLRIGNSQTSSERIMNL